jgi:hypothetical protein
MTHAEHGWRDGQPEDEDRVLVESTRMDERTGPGEADNPREAGGLSEAGGLGRSVGPAAGSSQARPAPTADPLAEDDPLLEAGPLEEADPLEEAALEEADPLEEPGPLAEAGPPVELAANGAGGAGGGFPASREHREQLLGADELASFTARWQEIQAGFVDEPRRAVADADAIVADLMQRLTTMLASEREQLESHRGTGQDVSTEDLRQGLRRYRSLFERLLAA